MHFAFHANIRSHYPLPPHHTIPPTAFCSQTQHSFVSFDPLPMRNTSITILQGQYKIGDLVYNACSFSSWFLTQSFNELYGSQTFRIVISLWKQACVYSWGSNFIRHFWNHDISNTLQNRHSQQLNVTRLQVLVSHCEEADVYTKTNNANTLWSLWRSVFRKASTEIQFLYFDNNKIYWIFMRWCIVTAWFSIKCRLFHYFTFPCSYNTFILNHVLKLKKPPQ
jgi:hypothetical protein